MPASTQVRQTAAIGRVIDNNLNSWEDFAGIDLNVDVVYQFFAGDTAIYDQNYWTYRGQAGVAARTTDGAIVRARIGDGSALDRTVYRQIITDPTDAASWESWTQLYTGSHYAIAVIADATAGAGYRIIHAKSDGLYVDNVLKITEPGIVKIKPMFNSPLQVYYQTVEQDVDGGPTHRWWVTRDVTVGSRVGEAANYRWYRSDMVALQSAVDPEFYYRFRSMAHEAASRDPMASQSLTIEWVHDPDGTDTDFNQYENVRFLKGPSGHAGYKTIENLQIAKFTGTDIDTSGHFLFYNERHFDIAGNVSSNLKNPLFWSHWRDYPWYSSMPTPVGYSIWGFAGVVEWGDYIYLCGNGRVLRRPKDKVQIDLTNYLLDGSYSIPRDNQKATGNLILPNPGNVLGAQLNLSDTEEAASTGYRLELAIGQKAPGDNSYTYKRDEDWWVSSLRKIRAQQEGGTKERLEIGLANFWDRLENPFLDTVSIPGKMEWNDWQEDAPNQLYNYSNDTDEFNESVPLEGWIGLRTVHSGTGAISGLGGKSITLFAGWRGENAYVRLLLWEDGGVVFRYQDAENFYYAKFVAGDKITLIVYADGNPTTLASETISATGPTWLTVDFRWGRVRIDVDFDATVLGPLTLVDPEIYTGFVGWVCAEVGNFTLNEWNSRITTGEIIKTLLAYANEYDAELELDEETAAAPIMDMILGPQSDLKSPEQAFRQVLEASKLQVVWKEDE